MYAKPFLFLFPFLRTLITKLSTFQALCALLFTWSTQFKSLGMIIPKYLQKLVSGNLVTEGVTQWIFNPSSRKSYCLSFTGIYLHLIFYSPFFTPHFLPPIYLYLIFYSPFIYTPYSTADIFTPHFLQSIHQ